MTIARHYHPSFAGDPASEASNGNSSHLGDCRGSGVAMNFAGGVANPSPAVFCGEGP